jgi:hypothetical protein
MAWLRRNSFQILIIVSILIILAIGVLIFYYNFHNQKFPKNLSDWAYFSSYAGLIVSICNILILGAISTSFNGQNIKLQKPCIIFKISLEEAEKAYYIIKNVGKGAALNIIVKHKNNKGNEKWDSSTICYSLGQNDELKLLWKKGGDEWIAVYDDILGNHYDSNIKGDTMTFNVLNDKLNKMHRSQKSKALWNTQKDEYTEQ